MKSAEIKIALLHPANLWMRWLPPVAVLLCVGVLLTQDPAAAADRALRGTVTNDGEPMRGVVVQLENCATLQIRTYITQKDGQYHFSGLMYGVDYEVWAKRGNQQSKRKILSQFNENRLVTIDLILE
jgi:hypothetical protein